MAQDLEKSKAGRRMVRELRDGTKTIDVVEAVSTLLASNADVGARLEELEKKRKASKKAA